MVDTAVAVVLWCGGNHVEESKGGPAHKTVPAKPFSTAAVFIVLDNDKGEKVKNLPKSIFCTFKVL